MLIQRITEDDSLRKLKKDQRKDQGHTIVLYQYTNGCNTCNPDQLFANIEKSWALMEEKYLPGTEVDETARLHDVSRFYLTLATVSNNTVIIRNEYHSKTTSCV